MKVMSPELSNKLHRRQGEPERAHRAFLLWTMQAKMNRNKRAVSRAIKKSHTTISNYLTKFEWELRVTSLSDESEAQQLYRSLYMSKFAMTEISAVQKYIATPLSTSGTLDRSIGESVQKAVKDTSAKDGTVHEKEVQRKHIMLLDAAIGYIAQGLKAGDMKRQIRDLPVLIQLRKQIAEVENSARASGIVYESIRVKEAKESGENVVEAMYEDAKELAAILGSLRISGASEQVHNSQPELREVTT